MFKCSPGGPPRSTQEFAARIAGDSEKWTAVIELTGAKID
jgi:hypothetical protein